MSQRPGQSTSSGGPSQSSRKPAAPSTARNDPKKITLKGPAGKNLLPSKIVAPKPEKEKNEVKASNSNSKLDSTLASTAHPQPVQGVSQQYILDMQYGMYLQSFLESVVAKETKDLEIMKQLNGTGSRCSNLTETEKKAKRTGVNRKIVMVSASLKNLEKIRSAFDNLVDFTGEETLMEIRVILTNKYDKLKLEGAAVNKPLFDETELEGILNILRTQLGKKDNAVVLGWCAEYVEKLGKLTVSSKETSSNTSLLEDATRLLLENFSLHACDDARKLKEDVRIRQEEQGKKDAAAGDQQDGEEGKEQTEKAEGGDDKADPDPEDKS